MNRDPIEGMWKQLSGKLRERWGMLTSDRLSVASAYRPGDGMSDSDVTRSDAGFRQPDSPFVLVAHGTSGRWDVYATVFDRPLASFDERQAACDYASDLAKTRRDPMVLIQDRQGSAGSGVCAGA